MDEEALMKRAVLAAEFARAAGMDSTNALLRQVVQEMGEHQDRQKRLAAPVAHFFHQACRKLKIGLKH